MNLLQYRLPLLISLLACLTHSGTCEVKLLAADGAWNVDFDGSWSDTNNWSNSIVADGVNSTASFTTTSPHTITLDTSRTLGYLNFSGGESALPWLVNAADQTVLNLSAVNGIPTIDVTPNPSLPAPTPLIALNPHYGHVQFNVPIAGNSGLRKTGTGTLELNHANSYTGDTIIAGGTLVVSDDSSLGNPTNTIIFEGAGEKTLATSDFLVHSEVAQNVFLHAGGMNYLSAVSQIHLSGTWSGDGSLTIKGQQPAIFTAANTYRGETVLADGGLGTTRFRAKDGVGLPRQSVLVFADGILETSGVFSRPLGTAPGHVRWESSGGFGAHDGPLEIRLNGGKDTVTVGINGFIPAGQKLYLSNDYRSGYLLDFQNSIDLANSSMIIEVTGQAKISGAIRNGDLSTYGGILTLTGSNTHGNTNVRGTRLQIGDGGTIGAVGTGTVDLYGGALIFNRSDTFIVNNKITGLFATITQAGTGTTILAGDISEFGSNQGIEVLRGELVIRFPSNSNANSPQFAPFTEISLGTGKLTLDGGDSQESLLGVEVTGEASIERASGTTTIALNSIYRQPGGTLNLSADDIATTRKINTNGVLAGVTVAGQLAKNENDAADGPIVALSASEYIEIQRSGGTISNGMQQIKFVDNAGDSPVKLGEPGTTTINTITQAAAAGTTTVEIGQSNTLRLGAAGHILLTGPSSDLRFKDGTLTAGGADSKKGEIIVHNDALTTVTIDSAITNNGTAQVVLTKGGPGVLHLTAPNSYSGGTYINNGTLVISNENQLGSPYHFPGASLQINGGALRTTATMTMSPGRDIDIGPGGATIDVASDTTLTVAGRVSKPYQYDRGSADLVKTGLGSLVLHRIDHVNTSVEEGVLEIAGNSLYGLVNNTIKLASETELILRTNGFLPINASISGAGRVMQAGFGFVELGGVNTYTGPTLIKSGTLLVNGSLTGTSITVAAGGAIGGTGEINCPITIEEGTIAPGASIGSMNVGNLSLSSSSLFQAEFSFGSSPNLDLLNVAGELKLGGASLTLTQLGPALPHDHPFTLLLVNNDLDDPIIDTFSSVIASMGFTVSVDYAYSGTDAIGRIGDGNDLAIIITPVPEPAAVTLSLGAWLSVIAYRRRRK